MSGPADRFEAEIDALSNVRLAESGEYLHEYTGVLAESDERVRIVTLAPELADANAAVDAFARVSDQWYNASANANIRTIRDRGTEPRPWIAVPDYGGDTLATLEPDLAADTIETVISETADALRTLGLYNTVHGHLSPDDIYVRDASDRTETPSIHVGGFGLEAAIQDAVGEFEPTAYTAPELVGNSHQPTEQTDVYGMGAVTYFVLTGQPPIEGSDLDQSIQDGPPNPPSAYDDAVPSELDEAVMQALSTRPEDRYDSPYVFGRAFLNTFGPDDFRPDDTGGGDDNGGETTDSGDSAGAEPDTDEDSPSDGDDDATESDDSEETGLTRRVAVGLLSIGALSGAGWYLSRGQLTGADETATDPAKEPATPPPPAEPSASISVTPTDPAIGEAVTFSATASTTGEGVTLETYEWAVGTNTAFAEGEQTRTHSFPESGEQTVRLRITDSQDRTATVTTTVAVEPPADGAPMFQYDAANTGTNPDETGPKTSIAEQWSYETGRGVGSSPAVVDGTVYIGSLDGSVYAIDAAGGTERWAYETNIGVYSSPAVVDGTVYVGSFDGAVYALDAADGGKKWTYQTGRLVQSSPTVVDGVVYVGSNDNTVYALDAADGTEYWTYETGAGVFSSPAVTNGTVYVGGEDSTVYALSADDGTEQWTFDTTGSGVSSDPAVVDGTVYVGSNKDTVYTLDAADGTQQWRSTIGNHVYSSPAVANGTVYVGSNDNTVYALSATDGTEQWTYDTEGMVFSSPAVVDGTVYIGSNDNTVYAVSAADGTEQWSYPTGGEVGSSPAVVNDTVFVGSDDNHVYALAEE